MLELRIVGSSILSKGVNPVPSFSIPLQVFLRYGSCHLSQIP